MTKVTPEEIAKASKFELQQIKYDLITDFLKLEKFFESFLDKNELDDNDLDSPEWFTYREMMTEYDRVDSLIRSADFYLGKHS